MSRYAIITDLNRCTGCLGCTVACKVNNEVPIGNYFIRAMRVGPTPKADGCGGWPDVDMYFLPMQCQHCQNPDCVSVCPTGASMKLENGIVKIDPELCIGCQACISACPYGVRFLNEETNVVQKCTFCVEKLEKDELPSCVAQCCTRARYFGDWDEGIESFVGPDFPDQAGEYDEQQALRVRMVDYVEPFEDDDIHYLPNEGTDPQNAYILRGHYGDRRDRQWLDQITDSAGCAYL